VITITVEDYIEDREKHALAHLTMCRLGYSPNDVHEIRIDGPSVEIDTIDRLTHDITTHHHVTD
jgi:hypothetical protein